MKRARPIRIASLPIVALTGMVALGAQAAAPSVAVTTAPISHETVTTLGAHKACPVGAPGPLLMSPSPFGPAEQLFSDDAGEQMPDFRDRERSRSPEGDRLKGFGTVTVSMRDGDERRVLPARRPPVTRLDVQHRCCSAHWRRA